MYVTDEMVVKANEAYMANIAAQPTMTKIGKTAMRAALTAALESIHSPGLSLEEIDQAFAAEIERVSTLEYNSNTICRHFYGELRKRLEKPLPAPPVQQKEGV